MIGKWFESFHNLFPLIPHSSNCLLVFPTSRPSFSSKYIYIYIYISPLLLCISILSNEKPQNLIYISDVFVPNVILCKFVYKNNCPLYTWNVVNFWTPKKSSFIFASPSHYFYYLCILNLFITLRSWNSNYSQLLCICLLFAHTILCVYVCACFLFVYHNKFCYCNIKYMEVFKLVIALVV